MKQLLSKLIGTLLLLCVEVYGSAAIIEHKTVEKQRHTYCDIPVENRDVKGSVSLRRNVCTIFAYDHRCKTLKAAEVVVRTVASKQKVASGAQLPHWVQHDSHLHDYCAKLFGTDVASSVLTPSVYHGDMTMHAMTHFLLQNYLIKTVSISRSHAVSNEHIVLVNMTFPLFMQKLHAVCQVEGERIPRWAKIRLLWRHQDDENNGDAVSLYHAYSSHRMLALYDSLKVSREHQIVLSHSR